MVVDRPLDDLCRLVTLTIKDARTCNLLITGPSAVGKSYFAKALADEVKRDEKSVSVINVDNFLKPELRGSTSYQAILNRPLLAKDFDYIALKDCQLNLRTEHTYRLETYIRGKGWGNVINIEPGDFLIFEGLFLDSIEAAKYLTYDLGLILEAEPLHIKKWREERDQDVQRKNGAKFRNASETAREIERTQMSYLSYYRASDLHNFLKVRITEKHYVSSITTAT